MADPHIIHTLTAKQAEIEGYIRDTEKRLAQARADLAHVNATIRLFETQRDATTQFPAYIKLNRLFRRGELTSLCTDALHAAPEGTLDTRELAAAVMNAKGWDGADKALSVSVARNVVHTLDEARRRKRGFEKVGKRDGVNVWRVSESVTI